MARIARVNRDTGRVENIIMPYAPPEGYLELEIEDTDQVDIGHIYKDGMFSDPETAKISKVVDKVDLALEAALAEAPAQEVKDV